MVEKADTLKLIIFCDTLEQQRKNNFSIISTHFVLYLKPIFISAVTFI